MLLIITALTVSASSPYHQLWMFTRAEDDGSNRYGIAVVKPLQGNRRKYPNYSWANEHLCV